MNPSENTIETKSSYNWIENGIIVTQSKDNAYITLDDAKETTTAFQALSNVALPLLVDLHTSKGISAEARTYFGKDPIHLTTHSAVAMLVANPVAKIIANFFKGLSKPDKPLKLFTDKNEALKWLEQFKNSN